MKNKIGVELAHDHPDPHRDDEHDEGGDEFLGRDLEVQRGGVEQQDQGDHHDPHHGRGHRHQKAERQGPLGEVGEDV